MNYQNCGFLEHFKSWNQLKCKLLGFEFQVQLTCFDLDVLSLRKAWIEVAHRRVPNRRFRYNRPVLDAGIYLGGTYGGFHGCTQLDWRESQSKAIHSGKWCEQLGVLLEQQLRSRKSSLALWTLHLLEHLTRAAFYWSKRLLWQVFNQQFTQKHREPQNNLN